MTSMKKELVSAIVLNWNNKEVIFPCLDSLLRQTYEQHEIILVDNGSQDGSLEAIKERYAKRLRIVENGKNLGFDEGVNIGIRASDGEFIALLNSDAVAERDWIEHLVRGIQGAGQIGMCASKIYLADQEGVLDNTGEILYRDALGRGRGRLEKDRGQYDVDGRVLCPSGCAGFYRRQMLEEMGLFDKHFFAYAEDIDVGLRGRLLGYECVYISQAVVFHKLSISSGLVSDLKAFYVERNRMWVTIKCFPFRYLLLCPFYTLIRYGYHLYGLFRREGPASKYIEQLSFLRLVFVIIKVYLSTLWFLPYLLSERRRIRKNSKVTSPTFGLWLREFGMSARDAALSELS